MNTEWETPDEIFLPLQEEFGLDLDVCATDENAKLPRYYTKEQDGLVQPWDGRVWCNPPYGRGLIEPWVSRAANESWDGHAPIVVCLLPAWTDRRWFHEWIWDRLDPCGDDEGGGCEIDVRFLPRRIKFLEPGGVQPKSTGTFGSMVVVFRHLY